MSESSPLNPGMADDGESGDFTLPELVDLALCSPEVGAVNFNILRILLHNIIEKLGIVDQKATLNDLQAHQINNFMNYIQGAGTSSPMPGVLRYAPGTEPASGLPPGPGQHQQPAGYVAQPKTPRTGRQGTLHSTQDPMTMSPRQSEGRDQQQQQQYSQQQQQYPQQQQQYPQQQQQYPQQQQQYPQQQQQPKNMPLGPIQSIGAVYTRQTRMDERTNDSGVSSGPGSISSSGSEPIEKKVARLERHLEALYALPTNSRLLRADDDKRDSKNMSVNDMWQIIQLNNRVAAAEAAIQKMASLIEEVASQIKLLKSAEKSASGMKKQFETVAKTSSDLAMQMEPCMEKCEHTAASVIRLKEDLEKIKKHLVDQIKKLSSAAGVRLSKTPSFMEPRKSITPQDQAQGQGSSESGEGGMTQDGQQRVSADSGGPSSQQRTSGSEAAGQQRGSDGTSDGQRRSATSPGVGDDYYGRGEEAGATSPGAGDDYYGRGEEAGEGMGEFTGPGYNQWVPVGEMDFDEAGNPVPSGNRASPLVGPDGEEGQGQGEDKKWSSTSQELGDDANSAHGQARGAGTETITAVHPEHRHQAISHIPVDVPVGGGPGKPLEETVEDQLDPFEDLVILEDGTVVAGQMDAKMREECRNQADMVQKEMQEQYTKLQEMQRRMANEIQDKMELVYQKLLREISTQHATTSPYMAVGLNAEKCMGPGVCSGFGLPAGTAVCQFPQKPEKVDVCAKDGKVCPGKDVCPGKEVCPTCKNDILHNLRVPGDRARTAGMDDYTRGGLSSSQENMLRQLTSMVLLPRDLEDLREKLRDRGNMPDVFDESDVLEKLQTLWEAVNILKNNEENMAVRIVQQDAALKRIPEDAMQKLDRISASNLDELEADGRFGSRMKGLKDLGSEDVQLIFSNLSSLVLENAAMKEKLQKINDTLFNFEQSVVTRPMLMNALGDKADKGQMNTKVSYDEFGAGMDELQSRLGNLLQEVYRKNELWKEITDQMREDLGEKLDKVEISPLRAYFKNHLGKLEEKVNHLTQIMEEPDPAGTRKKLLRDYNCLSCDRHTNISGMTNAPLLPVLGPILAGHSTASQRAFELYRMRPQSSRYDPEGRNFCQMERQGRDGNNNMGGTSMPLNDSDMLHLVNRYVGGSHTAISPQERIATLHKRASMAAGVKPNLPPEVPRPRTSATGAGGGYYEE